MDRLQIIEIKKIIYYSIKVCTFLYIQICFKLFLSIKYTVFSGKYNFISFSYRWPKLT